MKEIPLVIEMLYHEWVHIPPQEDWPPDYEGIPAAQIENLYAFYQGLCLGVNLSKACLDR